MAAQAATRAPRAARTQRAERAPRVSRAASRAQARSASRYGAAASSAAVTCGVTGCSDNAMGANATATVTSTVAATQPARARTSRQRTQIADANGNGTIVGGRPSGCPHRYCGCAASIYVFGEIRKDLNLAANWARKFPRTQPAAGMVAARPGHVFVLMRHVEGNDWLVYDGNSGGGRTREHVRSIRGYAIVNPRVTMTAQN